MPETMDSWFGEFKQLETINNLEKINTSRVTEMCWMFWGDEKLQKLDLSIFDTKSVINMEGMFSHCFGIEEIDVSSFNTSNVTNMASMFYTCESMKEINVKSFNTSNIIDMTMMFNVCHSLTELDLTSFNTCKVKVQDYNAAAMLQDITATVTVNNSICTIAEADANYNGNFIRK